MGDKQELYSQLDWNDLAIFLAVAHQGSMSKASSVLGKTQVTIRNRLSYLEDRLQSKLFVRESTGMVITDMGRAILNRAEAMDVQAKEIGEIAEGLRRDDAAHISLEAPDGLATYWMARHLPDFQDGNQDYKITFNVGHPDDEDRNNRSDVAIRYKQDAGADYIVARIGKVHYVPITTQAYIDRHGCPKNMLEMLEHRILNHDGYGQQKQTWSKRNSAYHDLSQASFSTNCSPLLVESVKAGLGISMLPTWGTMSVPGLIMVDVGMKISLDFWLIHHKDAAAFGRINSTLEWCRDILSPEKYPCFRDEFIHPDTFADVKVIRH